MQNNFILKNKVFILAVLIGLMTGLIGIAFKFILLEGYQWIGQHDSRPMIYVILPFTMVLILAPLRHYALSKDNQGFGVSQVMYEIKFIKTRMMNPTSVVYKIVGTIVTLLSGFSVGIHGPITHIGGAVGSNMAHIFKMTDDETRVLIGCGVAGCLASAFHAPIFATLFVVEVIFKKRFFDMMGTILLSGFSGYFIAHLINPTPYLEISAVLNAFDLKYTLHFIILGLIMGTVAIVYVSTLEKTVDIFNHFIKNRFIKAALGATGFSIFYYLVGKNFTYGINLQELITRDYSQSRWFLMALTIIILTAITMASGGMGGLFSPGLYIGFSMGIGISSSDLMGFQKPVSLGLVAMAAMFSGFAHAPLTAAFMVIEFTGQYQLIYPALITTLSASFFSEYILKESIYHNNLNRLIQEHDKYLI